MLELGNTLVEKKVQIRNKFVDISSHVFPMSLNQTSELSRVYYKCIQQKYRMEYFRITSNFDRTVYQIEHIVEKNVKCDKAVLHLFQNYVFYLNEMSKVDPMILKEENPSILKFIVSQVNLFQNSPNRFVDSTGSAMTLSNLTCIMLMERRIFANRLYQTISTMEKDLDANHQLLTVRECWRMLETPEHKDWMTRTSNEIHHESWNGYLDWLTSRMLSDSVDVQKSMLKVFLGQKSKSMTDREKKHQYYVVLQRRLSSLGQKFHYQQMVEVRRLWKHWEW
jgi:hypothetical protein